jgi:hypothetical protein
MPPGNGSGRNYPIHFLMERSTAKTGDCWIELPDNATMDHVMRRYTALQNQGRPAKLNGRILDMERTNQGELMRAIFPHTKDMWFDPETGIPVKVKAADGEADLYSQGFRGFLTREEMRCVVIHALQPNRVCSIGLHNEIILTKAVDSFPSEDPQSLLRVDDRYYCQG